jgi:alpha-1,6-mannosyltransferase
VYLVAFTLRFPLPEHYWRLHDLGGLTQWGADGLILYLLAIGGLFLLYALAWREVRHMDSGQARRIIFFFAGIFGITLLFLYPITAIDVYLYMVHAGIWINHGANPLIVSPSAFPEDPLTRFAAGMEGIATPYGPLWVMFSALPNVLAGDNLFINILLFKGLALLSFLGCAGLIWHILSKVSPGTRAAGTLLFAWNPLALLLVVGNGHNDATMMLFVLTGVWLALSPWRVASLAALVVAGLVKYTAFVLLPIALIVLIQSQSRWQDRIRSTAIALLLAGLAAILGFLPFWEGQQTFAGLSRQADTFVGSPAAFIFLATQRLFHDAIGSDHIKGALALIFGFFYLIQLIRTYRQPGQWLSVSFEVMFALMFVVSWFNTWYLVWPLALAALNHSGLVQARVALFSFTAAIGSLYYTFLWVWYRETWGLFDIHLLAVPLIFLPPALLTFWGWGHSTGVSIARSQAIRDLPPTEQSRAA